ncbi:MAG: hypothetical protein MPEBLZ_02951 [Candidatus Methanoperedens nitroreducens]|uniref:Uncharacterized protein n=1 Tax=Candidatus Methanoperedens nitratireducens TaxID=1392998 RepID=A0A0P7ZFX8_9EURY|nr:hypothetical protein [Candidatus Methanoperedens sp. BLZ2]KAB2944909.1 MAG: hypothetical protein F9K14_12780 [Candidatus Methanoperedens sp.]KPQ42493.1 MAG: hypothetical protein MPEBLZ_02951 [Candidatus Methanoperedens sp. BLZ1]MBZ0173785.1 hypothetical protein [Candidatus Methanoperedens nitroreducens]MCX9078286.1 hypothetical protein [Candidatus Methanoperedens sp.]
MNNNRKNALWLAGLSFAASLLVSAYITTFQYSPVVVIYPFISLLGIIGILLRKKEVLIISALISLALMILGIMTVGGLFFISSLPLLISTFVYPGGFEKVDVDKTSKRTARIIMIASLFAAVAAGIVELSWLYVKFSSGKWILSDIEFVFLILLLSVLPVLGLIGISRGNRDFLNTSAAISIVLAVFMGIFLRRPMFLVSTLLLMISAFVYGSGIKRQIKKEIETEIEIVDPGFKKTALVLAGASMLVAVIITLYSEIVLIADGCYTYHTSSTSGGTICSDFRPDYVIPVLLSFIGIVGILRENKLMLYSSAAVSFVRMVVYLSQIAVLFLPSFLMLIISAFVYQKGIRKAEGMEEASQNNKQYYVLLLLFVFVILWIIGVYIFVQPSSITGESGYGQAPAKQIP